MKFSELEPVWLNTKTRLGVGVRFHCTGCGTQIQVLFLNPMDGKPPLPNMPDTIANNSGNRWARSGLNFEELSLHPSVNAISSCKPECTTEKHVCAQHDHGHWNILHGEIFNC